MDIPGVFQGPILKMVEAQIKPIAKNIAANIEAMLAQAGEQQAISHFELSMLIKHEDNTAKGWIKHKDKNLYTIDMLPYIVNTYTQCYNNLPDMLRGFVDKEMGGDSISEIVCKLLEESPVLVEYNEDDELIAFRLEENQKYPLKQADFIGYVKKSFGWE